MTLESYSCWKRPSSLSIVVRKPESLVPICKLCLSCFPGRKCTVLCSATFTTSQFVLLSCQLNAWLWSRKVSKVTYVTRKVCHEDRWITIIYLHIKLNCKIIYFHFSFYLFYPLVQLLRTFSLKQSIWIHRYFCKNSAFRIFNLLSCSCPIVLLKYVHNS